MTANYYTLSALVRELRPILVGAKFAEAYSHRPNELRLRFDRGTLVAILRPINGALFFSTSNEQRPRSNVQPFFEELAGLELRDIEISPTDRQVLLSFEGRELQIRFYGSPNAVLLKQAGVIDSFKKLTEAKPGAISVSKLGKRYLREALARGIRDEQLESELSVAAGAFVYDKVDEILLSVIPLTNSTGEVRRYESLNEAIRYTIVERAKRERVASLRRELLTMAERDIDRLERSRSEMRRGAEDSTRPERYTSFANAILMHAHEIEKGSERFVADIDEQQVTIALDPTLSAYENATRYFERAKRAKESREDLKQRAKMIADQLAQLEMRRSEILGADSYDALLALKQSARNARDQKDDGPRFRQYTVAGNMTVLVGKNAKQNDELTQHTAKKDDIWLHARGVPGSHVVLQVAGRKQVPKEAIVQAAEIAAYHSDAKSQKHAPVSYTQKKYVRKPKGADPGAVVMEREEVIMVTPRTPSL